MKKIFAIFLLVLLLCGCSKKVSTEPNPKFLTGGKWEGNDSRCTNVIRFGEEGEFSNFCVCGEPVGDADLAEKYTFSSKDNTVTLYDCDDAKIETGKLLYADDMYLIIDLWGRAYVYENLNENIPTVRKSALEYTNTENLTKPCLSILGYKDNTLTVSSYDYDGDAAPDFKEWKLSADKEITFSTVSVTVTNGDEKVETAVLSESDLENIGEHYTSGYLEIGDNGKVKSVVFYGELIIEE